MALTVKITFFAHGTTTDNERHLLTGWSQGQLSESGRKQCEELAKLLEGRKFDAIFSSDLGRAVETARIVFGCSARIITDKRLRERNYGLLTGHPSAEAIAFDEPGKKFPKGESYKDVEARVKDFLQSLSRDYAGKQVAIIAHNAPQLALKVLLNWKTWKQAIADDWRAKEPKEWEPGWEYELTNSNL